MRIVGWRMWGSGVWSKGIMDCLFLTSIVPGPQDLLLGQPLFCLQPGHRSLNIEFHNYPFRT